MGIGNKVNKLTRWGNIWLSQFSGRKAGNLKADKGGQGVILIKTDAIGDFIIWLDSAAEYRKIYSSMKITLICNGVCAQIAQVTGLFDDIITIDVKKFESNNNYRAEFLSQFVTAQYDVLIQTAYSRTIHMDLLAMGIPACRKLGMVSDESRTNLSRYVETKKSRKFFDSIYDSLVKTKAGVEMELVRNAEFIRGLGDNDFLAGLPVLKEQPVREGIVPSENYYVLFPGSSNPKKMWSIENFARISDYIYQCTGWTAYLCGSKAEEYLYDGFCGAAKKCKSVNYFAKTSLTELAEVIRNAKLIISNDTSGIHFAAAVNTPSVCIMGDFDYGRFLPYSYERVYDEPPARMYACHADMPCKGCARGSRTIACRRAAVQAGKFLCISNVTYEMVKDKVDLILDDYGKTEV